MGIGREKLEPVSTYLRGFSRERLLPLGSTQLVLTLGDPLCQATTTARFLIVDAPSTYNMLLGRPSLNAIGVVPSAYSYQISNFKWSRNGSRKPAYSQGMLLSINETKHGRQHLHGRARHARRGKHPTCSLRRVRACIAW